MFFFFTGNIFVFFFHGYDFDFHGKKKHCPPRQPFKNTIVGKPFLAKFSSKTPKEGDQNYFYQKYHSREANFDFFSLFLKFPFFDGGVPGGGARCDENSSFSVKKVGEPLTRKSK